MLEEKGVAARFPQWTATTVCYPATESLLSEALGEVFMVSVGSLLRKTTKVAARRLLPDVYSDLEFGKYAKSWIHPKVADVNDYYTPSILLGHEGIDFQVTEQLERLDAWRGERYQALFSELRQDPSINTPGLVGRERRIW
jgi:hypothetical protein